MKDVAAVAGVSVGTVSNVLNAPDIVAGATRARVLAVIDQLGWIPNETARQLRAGRSTTVGMAVMDIGNPFFADVLAGVESRAVDHGFSVHLGNSAHDPGRESAHLDLFEQHRVRGVVLAPAWEMNHRVERLVRRGIPVVIANGSAGSRFCSVSTDDVEGGRMAMTHLITQGHRQVAFVGGPDSVPQVRDRRSGAEQAIVYAGVDGHRLTALSMSRMDLAGGGRAAAEIVALPAPDRPTAVFAANDLLAIGLLQGFVTAGWRVPEDVALIGYDDIQFAAAAAVPLSSVSQQGTRMGHTAADLLFAEMQCGEAGLPHVHQQMQLTPSVVARESTGRRRG